MLLTATSICHARRSLPPRWTNTSAGWMGLSSPRSTCRDLVRPCVGSLRATGRCFRTSMDRFRLRRCYRLCRCSEPQMERSNCLRRRLHQCKDGEAGQPVFTHILAADVRQACVDVRLRDLASHIGVWRERSQRTPTPGAAEVQTVEMGDLAVAAVADDGGGEQGGREPLPEVGQESREPGTKFSFWQGGTHALGFNQR